MYIQRPEANRVGFNSRLIKRTSPRRGQDSPGTWSPVNHPRRATLEESWRPFYWLRNSLVNYLCKTCVYVCLCVNLCNVFYNNSSRLQFSLKSERFLSYFITKMFHVVVFSFFLLSLSLSFSILKLSQRNFFSFFVFFSVDGLSRTTGLRFRLFITVRYLQVQVHQEQGTRRNIK